jgi:hypothetical protein
MKTLTIQDANNWYGLGSFRFKRYSIVKHSKFYTGGEKFECGLIIGFVTRERESEHGPKDLLNHTKEVLYRVKYPNGSESVLWPEEAEALK